MFKRSTQAHVAALALLAACGADPPIGYSQFCTPKGSISSPTVNDCCGPVLDYTLCWY